MGLEHVDAADVGMDAGRLNRLGSVLDAAVAEGVFPAATLCVVRRGRIAWQSAHGAILGGAPARPDTIFDLASLTKPHTALALLRLVEKGCVSLTAPVGEFLPEARPALARVTIRQLATHTAGLVPWAPLYARAPGKDAMLREILSIPLASVPGERYAYSDLGYILLGEIVERVAGASLADVLRTEVLDPLGMRDTGFLPDASAQARIAPTANCPQRPGRILVGEVHDANAHFYGGVAGHAGLFGSATDLAILAAALLGGGVCGGRCFLGAPTLSLVRRNALSDDLGGQSIGWFTHPNGMLSRGDLLSDEAFGHTGFTGTLLVCDPRYGLAVALLTNRVMNPADNGAVQSVRRRVLNVTASAIVE
jgi:CubicO group peptidase (beta-lactamase class C family)